MSGWVKPVPYVDAVTKPFWDATLEGRLTFQECPACGHRQFYPRAACTACGGTPVLVDAAGTGEVHTFTIIRQYGGAGFRDELPYVVAMIDLDEGPRMMGNVTDVDPEAVRIGDRVRVWFADAGDRAHIPLWKPDRSS
jgi:uncharacterized OB-fold protein